MHTTIDYSKRTTPAFDAIEDIKRWFGPAKWAAISPMFAELRGAQVFTFYAEFAGVSGFPVKAWYELYHGEGSWDREWAIIDRQDAEGCR